MKASEKLLWIIGVGAVAYYTYKATKLIDFGFKELRQDAGLFKNDTENAGIQANFGGVEGRPYTWIDGDPYLTGGR